MSFSSLPSWFNSALGGEDEDCGGLVAARRTGGGGGRSFIHPARGLPLSPWQVLLILLSEEGWTRCLDKPELSSPCSTTTTHPHPETCDMIHTSQQSHASLSWMNPSAIAPFIQILHLFKRGGESAVLRGQENVSVVVSVWFCASGISKLHTDLLKIKTLLSELNKLSDPFILF